MLKLAWCGADTKGKAENALSNKFGMRTAARLLLAVVFTAAKFY